MRDVNGILIRPILTEKVLHAQEAQAKYAFQVDSSANKIEIKSAVEHKFNVVVKGVRTINVKGKSKRMNTRRGLTRGKRSDWKKAIVTLGEGHSIDFFEGKQA
jgi:large subunit ribosomal protein L23